jgi:hypothetical protein
MEGAGGNLVSIAADVTRLRLDPENPRLPEDIRGGEQAEILAHLFSTTVLEEIARSMVENGFFTHEALLVLPEGGDIWTVLEGNRRLAALTILLQLPAAEEAGLQFDLGFDPEPEGWRERLLIIPCFEVPTREEVNRYLGFRHIGGTKAWPPQAKARYLYEEVLKARDAGSDHEFLAVARRVGSNVQGVRNAVFAYLVLLRGREEAGSDIQYVLEKRFGVWQRALNSAHIRDFIGIGWPKRFDGVEEALEGLSVDRLGEVLDDMTPNGGAALLTDSREITVYGLSLENEYAYDAMRRFKSLDVARQIVEEAGLAERIRKATKTVEAIQELANRAANVDADIVASSEELFGVARALQAVARDRREEQ